MSKPEKPKPKTGKRIVSPGEYAKIQYQHATAWQMAFCCFGLALLCTGFMLFTWTVSASLRLPLYFKAITSLIPMGLATAVYYTGGRQVKKALAMEPVVSITCANTGHLPASKSLVRASAEPVQAQEIVLLRAAAQASETPAEQLVRPAGGQE